MKYGWVVLLLLVGALTAREASAQVSAYGEFSASEMTNLVGTNYIYGATTGVLVDGPKIYRRVLVSADIQGRFVGHGNQSLDGITVGPRFQLPIKDGKYVPFAEFMVGFARYHTGTIDQGFTGSTTDATIQFNGGLAKKLTPRWDAVADFSYAQYYALGGEFNPKTYSLGAVYHFVKR